MLTCSNISLPPRDGVRGVSCGVCAGKGGVVRDSGDWSCPTASPGKDGLKKVLSEKRGRMKRLVVMPPVR